MSDMNQKNQSYSSLYPICRKETLDFLKSKVKSKPSIGLVLGSGLGSFVNDIEVELSLPFHEIPHFGTSSVEGHSGNLIFGKVANKNVVIQQGRLHYYEGHSVEDVVYPVRVMRELGVQTIVLTNSAGGLADQMKPGDFMIIDDHINLTGLNPLIGKNLNNLGPRFPDMSEAYNPKDIEILKRIFEKNNIRFHVGTYAGVTGPSYETPAEVRYLKKIGCSAVGMSTVLETIAAHHMGTKIIGISCVTNLAAGLSGNKLTHSEVTETAKQVEKSFSNILKELILEISE